MPELYEPEDFLYKKAPIRIFRHYYDGSDIYTRLHWHRSVEFNLVTAGRIRMTIDGINQDLYPGDWCIVNSGELHSNRWIEPQDHFEGVALLISKAFIDHWLGSNIHLHYPQDSAAEKKIGSLLLRFGEHTSSEESADLDRMTLVFQLLILMRDFCLTQDESNSRRKNAVSKVKNIITYIDEHYTEPLELSDVAESFHYTSAHLSRMFKDNLGVNFYQYLQSVRLMHSVEELKTNHDLHLMECAINNGFPNVKSFIETFKRNFDCTPSEWLRSWKSNPPE